MLKSLLLGLVTTLFALTLVVFVPRAHVLATQGTCSDHGGVDCSAMADWDGSAVCQDGWRDSSELYSSVQECKIGKHYCTQTESNQLDAKYDLAGKYKKLSDASTQLQSLNYQLEILQLAAAPNGAIDQQVAKEIQGMGVTRAGIDSWRSPLILQNSIQQNTVSSEIITAKSQLTSLLGSYWNAWNQDTQECWALGDAEYAKLLQVSIPQPQPQQLQTFQSNQPAPVDPFAGISQDERCARLGYGTFYNTDKQSCDTCPSGTFRVAGANTCKQPTPIAKPSTSQILSAPQTIPFTVSSSSQSLATATLTATPTVKKSLMQKVYSWFRNLF